MTTSATTPSESSRVMRNVLVAVLAAVISGALCWLWWPFAAGMAWGGASVLIRADVSRALRITGAIAAGCVVGAAGLLGGPLAAGIVAALIFVPLALKA